MDQPGDAGEGREKGRRRRGEGKGGEGRTDWEEQTFPPLKNGAVVGTQHQEPQASGTQQGSPVPRPLSSGGVPRRNSGGGAERGYT